MIKFSFTNTQFKISYLSIILYLTISMILISLGFWQLSRAEEKQFFLNKQAQYTAEERLSLSSLIDLAPDSIRFRKIELTGEYDFEHQFLIDNQILNGRVGYFVMTPLKLTINNVISGQSVLVNRGWVELNKDRAILPNVTMNIVNAEIKGRINHFPSVGIKLAGAEIPTEGWPSVVQVVDVNVLAEKIGYSLLPFQVELDPSENDGYQRQWKTFVNMPPEKHFAYAIQWFGLAITLTLLFFWMSKQS